MKKKTNGVVIPLLLATLLIVAVAGTAFNSQQQRAFAADQSATHPYYPKEYWDRFKQYTSPTYLWHYDFTASDEDNQQNFDTWYCADASNSSTFTASICDAIAQADPDVPQQANDLMRYFAVYGDYHVGNFVGDYRYLNYTPPTYGIKSIVTTGFQSSPSTISDDEWQVFLAYEQNAGFQYNYNNSEQQNLQDYEQYLLPTVKSPDELANRWMWWNEEHRDSILYNAAREYLAGVPVPFGYGQISPDDITPSDVQTWVQLSGAKVPYLREV
jgi:hypothetical protein